MNKYYYCDLDSYGQRSGEVFSIELPDNLVHRANNLLFSVLNMVHRSGFVEYHTLLYTDYFKAQRSALD
jgi:hypothetical protein